MGAIRIGDMHFAGPVPDEGDNPTELEGKCGGGDGVHDENGSVRSCR